MSTVQANGLALELHEWGEPGSPALLLWHGAGATGKQFEQPARVLADEDGLDVLAPDAPGHGRSASLPPDGYLPSRLAQIAAGLLDARGVGEVLFGGFAWGACVACRFAAAYPERTRALVLVEAGVVDFHDEARYRDRPLDELVAEYGVDGALHWALAREPVVETYPALREHGTPVLVVTDAHGHYQESIGFDPIARLRAEVPQTEVQVIEDADGHDVLAREARNIARAIGDWLSARDLV
jgi:pimeloyl-ACP methyl ester carboxylesterase